jgi:hypothetical protein
VEVEADGTEALAPVSITVRCTLEERDAWHEVAVSYDRTLSSLIRFLLNREVRGVRGLKVKKEAWKPVGPPG